MDIVNDMLEKINLENIINKFASQKARSISFFKYICIFVIENVIFKS